MFLVELYLLATNKKKINKLLGVEEEKLNSTYLNELKKETESYYWVSMGGNC